MIKGLKHLCDYDILIYKFHLVNFGGFVLMYSSLYVQVKGEI